MVPAVIAFIFYVALLKYRLKTACWDFWSPQAMSQGPEGRKWGPMVKQWYALLYLQIHGAMLEKMTGPNILVFQAAL